MRIRKSRNCPECDGPDSSLYCCEPCARNFCTLLTYDEDNYNPECDFGNCCKCPGATQTIVLHQWEECPSDCFDVDCPSFCPEDGAEVGCTYGGGVYDEFGNPSNWCNEHFNGDFYNSHVGNNSPICSDLYGDINAYRRYHSFTHNTPTNYNQFAIFDDCSCELGERVMFSGFDCDQGAFENYIPYISINSSLNFDGPKTNCFECNQDYDWISGCPDPKAVNYHPYYKIGCLDKVRCYCTDVCGIEGNTEYKGALDCCQYEDIKFKTFSHNDVLSMSFGFINIVNPNLITFPDGSTLQDGDEIGFFQDYLEFFGQLYDNYILNCSNAAEVATPQDYVCQDGTYEQSCFMDSNALNNHGHFMVDNNMNVVLYYGYESIEGGHIYSVPFSTDDGDIINVNDIIESCDCTDPTSDFGYLQICPCACEQLTGVTAGEAFENPNLYECQLKIPQCITQNTLNNDTDYYSTACIPYVPCLESEDCPNGGICNEQSAAVASYRIKALNGEPPAFNYGFGWSLDNNSTGNYQCDVSNIILQYAINDLGALGSFGESPMTPKIYQKSTNTTYSCIQMDRVSGDGSDIEEENFILYTNNFGMNNISLRIKTGEECGLGCTDITAQNCSPYCVQCYPEGEAPPTAFMCQDDGSCIEHIFGCMDSNAFNFNPYATSDDGSCDYECRDCVFFGLGGIVTNQDGSKVISVMVSSTRELTIGMGQLLLTGVHHDLKMYGGMLSNYSDEMLEQYTTLAPYISFLCPPGPQFNCPFTVNQTPQLLFYLEFKPFQVFDITQESQPQKCLGALSPGGLFEYLDGGQSGLELFPIFNMGMEPQLPNCFSLEEIQTGFTSGDVNQDGMINVSDVIRIVSHIMGTEPLNELQRRIADINQDGQVNVQDILGVVNIILGNTPMPLQQQVEQQLMKAVRPLDNRNKIINNRDKKVRNLENKVDELERKINKLLNGGRSRRIL